MRDKAYLMELKTVWGSVDCPSTAKTILPSCSTSLTRMGAISSSGPVAPASCCWLHRAAACCSEARLLLDRTVP